jgi:hypothetical protein
VWQRPPERPPFTPDHPCLRTDFGLCLLQRLSRRLVAAQLRQGLDLTLKVRRFTLSIRRSTVPDLLSGAPVSTEVTPLLHDPMKARHNSAQRPFGDEFTQVVVDFP